ncbi:hypothetical protein L2E82_24915 [Cichorium intybus]|uniref:Uncharacterized protein n=1 Tax=Cichorium intybus TaxID=13427 RepID=A0ACB9E2H1_CICIN|nr:hypothetical protein L2E82_24915 [Cichorium intybus]
MGGLLIRAVNQAHQRWAEKKVARLRESSYGVHLWNKQSRRFRIEEESIMARLIFDNYYREEERPERKRGLKEIHRQASKWRLLKRVTAVAMVVVVEGGATVNLEHLVDIASTEYLMNTGELVMAETRKEPLSLSLNLSLSYDNNRMDSSAFQVISPSLSRPTISSRDLGFYPRR